MTIATGQDILAADINNLVKLVYKTADEVVNNSTTLQNDDHLLFAVAANEIWAFSIFINFLSGTTPDFKGMLSIPSGAILRAVAEKFFTFTNIEITMLFDSTTFIIAGSGVTDGADNSYVVIRGYIINGATANNLQLQWAQNVANASNTTVKKGSYIVAHKLA